MLVLGELADRLFAPPNDEHSLHGRRLDGSEGGVISTEHPSVARTWSTLPSCAVGLPASNSTTNRSPTPAAPASSSWRIRHALRVDRTISPTAAGLSEWRFISLPNGKCLRSPPHYATKYPERETTAKGEAKPASPFPSGKSLIRSFFTGETQSRGRFLPGHCALGVHEARPSKTRRFSTIPRPLRTRAGRAHPAFTTLPLEDISAECSAATAWQLVSRTSPVAPLHPGPTPSAPHTAAPARAGSP